MIFRGVSGGRTGNINVGSNPLIIDLANVIDDGPWVKACPDWLALPEVRRQILRLAWADGAAPPCGVGAEWWATLLSSARKMRITDIAVCCFGGHGRTGTLLAVFAMVTGHVRSAGHALQCVRKYCERAVETAAQVQYLNLIARQLKLKDDAQWT